MKRVTHLAMGLVLAMACSAERIQGGVTVIPTPGCNSYRLAAVRAGTQRQIAAATYDNRVCLFDLSGKKRWEAAVGGFVFDLAAGAVDGSGRDVIAVAAADGWVYLFGLDGQLRWKQDLLAPVYQVAFARLDGRMPVVLASGISRELVAFSLAGERLATAKLNGAGRMMRAGDFDGDGADEVAVLPIRGQAQDVCFFKGNRLLKVKETLSSNVIPWDPEKRRSKDTGENFRKGKRTWSGQTLKKANGTVANLDGKGGAELIYSPGAYTLQGKARQVLALPETYKVASYDYYYNMRLVAAGDLTANPGAEIVVVEGPQIGLYSASGEELGRCVASQGFTDVVYLPGQPHGSVLLGSSPNGDDNLYRLSFEPGWGKALAALPRQGFMARTGQMLKELGDSAAAWRGEPMPGADGPFDVVVRHHMWSGFDLEKIDSWMAEVRDYEKQFPYKRIRFATAFWPGEDAALLRPDGKPWGRDQRLAHDLTRAQIVAGAQRFESAGCHFWVQVGHGCDPHLEVATVAAILEAAPQTCLGFISAEDEQLDDVVYYFQHHVGPILDLCVKHGKRFIPRNKDVWWAHWPADPALRERIFDGRYRAVLLPSVEDSNSRSPEVNLAARVGLWLDGQVDDWASRCSADWFCASRAWEWEYVMTGHPQLRYYVSQAMLGARVFMLLNGERENRSDRWTRVGREGTATFLHLLGKGVIGPPRREQLQAISPVAVVLQQPSERFQRHGANGHHEEHWGADGSDAQTWAFDRLDTYWAMAPLPATDVTTYLWGHTRRDAAHVPVTAAHGFVCLLPGGPPRTAQRWSTLWTTDGDSLNKAGRPYSLTEARQALLADLAAGAKQQPLAVQGRVFCQIVALAPDWLLVALVDPGWLDPADREVTLTPQEGQTWKLKDRLSGQDLGELGGAAKIAVCAGGLRLVECRKTR